MTKIYTKILFILLLNVSANSFSQNLKEDLKSMRAYYSSDNYLSIDIDVKVFQNNASTASLVQKGKIRKKGKKFYYEYNESKMLVSESSVLMIQEQEKDILLRKISPKEYENYVRSTISFNMDSVLAKYDSVSFKGVKDGEKKYLIYTSNAMISRTELVLDASTSFIKKVVYSYNEKLSGQASKVEIDFKNSDAAFNEEVLSETRYISKVGTSYKLKPAYNNYNLILVNDED